MRLIRFLSTRSVLCRTTSERAVHVRTPTVHASYARAFIHCSKKGVDLVRRTELACSVSAPYAPCIALMPSLGASLSLDRAIEDTTNAKTTWPAPRDESEKLLSVVETWFDKRSIDLYGRSTV